MTEEQGTRPVLGHDKNGREVRAGDVIDFGYHGDDRWMARPAEAGDTYGCALTRVATGLKISVPGYEMAILLDSPQPKPTEAEPPLSLLVNGVRRCCGTAEGELHVAGCCLTPPRSIQDACRALARPLPAAPLTYARFRELVPALVEEFAPGSRVVTDQRWIVRPEGFTFLQYVAWVTVPGGKETHHVWFPQNDEATIRVNLDNLTRMWLVAAEDARVRQLVDAARGVPLPEKLLSRMRRCP